jgi:hypothetical protein
VRPVGDVFVNCQTVEERSFLKDHAHLLPDEIEFFLAKGPNLLSVDENLAAVRFEQTENQTQDC